jgi:hypothetical protein
VNTGDEGIIKNVIYIKETKIADVITLTPLFFNSSKITDLDNNSRNIN